MSTPNESTGPEQPGSQPSPDGHGSQPNPNAAPPARPNQPGGPAQPPPGYQQQPPPGYQQQQGYQQQPPPGYQQQPGYQQPGPPQYQQRNSNFKFEMPADAPQSMRDVMPVGGLSRLFKTDGLPPLLKISYIIWLVTAGLSLFFALLTFIASLIVLAFPNVRTDGIRGMVMTVISLVLIAAIVICAMKLKEGMQWARLALSAIVILGIVLMFFGAPGGGLLGVVAAVLMWLPESTAWLNAQSSQRK
ncbi:hypothetical protein [Arthrobacter sp.]|uniref:hypothetical protein n=1 Tax=Arthrobacter sp. TaxID=1667 RepID=UPI0026DF7F96|nr:hypothetical protein [Arthrobacter sp.]MDO5751567.1 hypothetical protein [Arthrobacter sp.]